MLALRHARQWLEQKNWSVRLAELEATWLLCCWLFVPIGMLFLVSRIGPSVYVVRATIVAASAFYLMAARGLMQLKGAARLAGAGVIALLLTAELDGYYREDTKEHSTAWSRTYPALSSPAISSSFTIGRARPPSTITSIAPMSSASASRHVDWLRCGRDHPTAICRHSIRRPPATAGYGWFSRTARMSIT